MAAQAVTLMGDDPNNYDEYAFYTFERVDDYVARGEDGAWNENAFVAITATDWADVANGGSALPGKPVATVPLATLKAALKVLCDD